MNHLFRAAALVVGVVVGLACGQSQADPTQVDATPRGGRIEVLVDAEGYHPAAIRVEAGKRLTLVFKRTTDQCCGQQVVFPSLDLRRELPLNQPVEVTVTPAAGTLSFTCGMAMYRGSIVAQ